MLSSLRRICDNIYAYIHFHSRKVGIIGLAMLTAFVAAFFCLSCNIVSISDGLSTVKLYTLKSDIAGILDYAGYVDNYNVKNTQKSGNRLSIEVTPTFSVYVTVGNSTTEVVTEKCSVKDVIEKAGISVNEKDMINLSLDTVLSEEAYIDIVPFVEPVPEVLPAVKKDVVPALGNVSVSAGGNRVISTLAPAFDIPLDENGLPLRYSSVTRVQATAYTYTGNRCATGVAPQPGYVAVNPAVIPYGTKMYIVSADGKYTYGYAVAADTGGYIHSRPTNIDLFMTSEAACRAFGRRDIYVYFVY